jgi:hypothetical protein
MTNNTPGIRTVSDLLAEKERISEQIRVSRRQISADLDLIRDEMNPFKVLSDGARKLLKGGEASPAVKQAVATATGFALENFVLKRAGWLPRIIVPWVVKKVSGFVVAPRVNELIVKSLHSAASSVREADIGDVLSPQVEDAPMKAKQIKMAAAEQLKGAHGNKESAIRSEISYEKNGRVQTSYKRGSKNGLPARLHQLADRIRR